jgi:hypothetical protein
MRKLGGLRRSLLGGQELAELRVVHLGASRFFADPM